MDILELRLATTDIAAQRAFYAEVLGFAVLEHTPSRVVFAVGRSLLVFEQTNAPLPGVYHVAFNIPENQFEAAQTWMAERVPLLADETGQTAFSVEHWNATMVYFADPAGNILELIARHTLANASDTPFSSSSILNISEIGIATEDVEVQVAALQARIGADVYRGPGHPLFTPLGDENGLLIVVQRGRIWVPDTGKPAEHVPVDAIVQGHFGRVRVTFA